MVQVSWMKRYDMKKAQMSTGILVQIWWIFKVRHNFRFQWQTLNTAFKERQYLFSLNLGLSIEIKADADTSMESLDPGHDTLHEENFRSFSIDTT